MEKYAVGVDIGGTTVKIGLFTIEGKVLSKWEIETRKESNARRIRKIKWLYRRSIFRTKCR